MLNSETALKHFRTLIIDLRAPENVQIIRYESESDYYDKIDLKWDNPLLTDKSYMINLKGYRVYYKEVSPLYSSSIDSDLDQDILNQNYDDADYENNDSSQDQSIWKLFEYDINSANANSPKTEITLSGIRKSSDYALKIVPIDRNNNEGEETEIQYAKKLSNSIEPPPSSGSPSFTPPEFNYEELNPNSMGAPRDVEILDHASKNVKFSWMPPQLPLGQKIKHFLISYVDRPKQYRESNGSIVKYHKDLTMSIKVPARGDPTMRISWLVAGLEPYTDYIFNLSTVMAIGDQQSSPVQRKIRTKPDRPSKIDQPLVLDIYNDNTVLLKLGNASEKNGPILKYWLVVVPLGSDHLMQAASTSSQSKQNFILMDELSSSNYEARDRDIQSLVKYSLYNVSLSNASAYIAAEFQSEFWPTRFILGDGNKYGRFINRRLTKGYDYKTYIVAFSNELQSHHNSAGSTTIQSNKQISKSQLPNMLDLGDLISGALESDLFSYSSNSNIFNTKYLDPNSDAIKGGIAVKETYENILWVAGAIAGLMFIFIVMILLIINLMSKNKSKQKQQQQNSVQINAQTLNMSGLNHSKAQNYVDTAVTLNRSGHATTNTLKKLQNKPNQKLISSDSSTSSTTASPTTALLSCSVNMNQASNNNSAGSGGSHTASSTHTNNTNVALINNYQHNLGLLTTASPIKPQNIYNLNQNNNESLYTSIEVTQKLLQNLELNNTITNTLSRMNQLSATYQHSQFLLSNNYDPIEYRRLNFTSQGLLNHPPIPCEELITHIERLKSQNNLKFSQEYESIEPGQQFTWDCSTQDLNRQKNRYANVIAYDHSRVVLTKLPPHVYSTHNGVDLINGSPSNNPNLPPPPPPPPGSIQPSPTALSNCSDYINANFMDGYRKRHSYIATQGPLPSTIGDFWRMCWEQQTHIIVMLTKLEEKQRLKCDQYWPNRGTETYDNVMQVTLVDTQELSFYTIRTFVIQPVNTYAQMQQQHVNGNAQFEMRREVKQFQYLSWPDHGVPEHPTSFLMFIRRVKLYQAQITESTINNNSSSNNNAQQSNNIGPMVVHCSAGVGRTGCFIVCDSMIEKIRQEKSIDIYGHVTCLRSQRNYMIQTEDQYIFCYDSLLEAAQSGQTEVQINQLYTHLQYLLQHNNNHAESMMLTEMELEYKRLSNAKAPQSKFQTANMAVNKFKNRLVNILPYESTRVVLSGEPTQGQNYINASFIDGYKIRHAYIATQAPLEETCDDFWRMLWEHNSTIVVMLTKLREMGREKCVQYWPSDRSIRYQYFVVDPIAEYNMNSYLLREFKVTDARDGQSRTVRQFQFVDWPEQGVPTSGESIIELIGQVHKTREQFGQTGPICVHCSAGVGRTGVFITLSYVLERMRYEGVIDVFNTVKFLRTQRPAMVQTEDQYQFCYRAALEYLGSFESYE